MMIMSLIAQTTETQIADYLSEAGVIGLLAFVIVAGMRQWWVWGWQYRELITRISALEVANDKEKELLRKERNEWRDIALENLNLTTRTVSVAERISRSEEQ